MKLIGNDWDTILEEEFDKDYYKNLRTFLNEEYSSQTIFPPAKDIYNALRITPYNEVKVLILGQDPYHEENQAHGLAFSVNKEIQIPPSLLNIYKELNSDLNTYIPDNGYLIKWAKQGVLLLNTVLTVEAHKANSHKGKGWEILTDAIISSLNNKEHMVYILWGRNARNKTKLITNPNHLILESAHPSPLSAYNGFFGSKPFSKTNEYLIKNNLSPIDWQIENIREK